MIEIINRHPVRDYLADLTDGELSRYQHTLETFDSTKGRLFRALKERKGQWVPSPVLGKAAMTRCMAGNIAKLREHGCLIDNKLVYTDNAASPHEVHVFYKLNAEPIDAIRARQQQA